MTWNGLTAGGLKGPAAQAAQNAFDQHQAAALEKQRPVEVDYQNPAIRVKVEPKGDGLTAHLDGGFEPGACTCNWRRDGRLGIAKRQDGSIIDGNTCPTCRKALYQ